MSDEKPCMSVDNSSSAERGVEVALPNGKCVRAAPGAPFTDLLQKLPKSEAKKIVAAKLGDQIVDLTRPVPNDEQPLRLVSIAEDDGLYVLRHSCAHVMAEAICRLYPQTQLVYGPPVENGFYYDIDLDKPLTPEDFPAIEAEMKKIIDEDRPFVRVDVEREPGLDRLRKEGSRYKLDNAMRAEGDTLSWYFTGQPTDGGFEDLCRGPHLPSTGWIAAFKVMQVSGAYYRGDQREKQLQRVYGTAWPSRKELDAYLHQLEEAKKRDHRKLGQELGLFTVSQEVGQGLVLWMPKGAVIRHELETFIRDELLKRGYQPVYTPHIGKAELFRTSGHYPYYADSMFAPLDCEGEEYLLKPMNCPHHIHIYKALPRSYRDLPVRLAEFGTVYRYEKSGELAGMIRVRGFTQDDAHQFCTPDQLADELKSTVELTQFFLGTLGMGDYRVRLGFRGKAEEKYVGAIENWQRSEAALLQATETLNIAHTVERGEAAFYGPKIDFVAKDCLGREWQLGTVQVDYNLPERFQLTYVGADNAEHRPVMIHRALFGSLERFVGILIEHYAGKFPLWLAPVQATVCTVSAKSAEYGRRVFEDCKQAGLRVELDVGDDRINAKIRRATLMKIPYILVVGEQEAAGGTVNIRTRDGVQQGTRPLAEFLAACSQEILSRGVATTAG
jgi:threonyl-tRNA synthetase